MHRPRKQLNFFFSIDFFNQLMKKIVSVYTGTNLQVIDFFLTS